MNEEKTTVYENANEDRSDRRSEPRVAKAPKMKIMMVDNCALVNVRKEPETDAAVARTLVRGTLVKVDPTYKNEKFAKVRYSSTSGNDDGEGFIIRQFLSDTKEV